MRTQLVLMVVAALALGGPLAGADEAVVPASASGPVGESPAAAGAQLAAQGHADAAVSNAASASAHSGPEAQGGTAPTAPGADGSSSAPVTLSLAVPPPADFKPPPGYRPVTKGLTTLYCKSETPLGSRVSKTHCYTAEQLEEMERQSEAARRMMFEKARMGGASGN